MIYDPGCALIFLCALLFAVYCTVMIILAIAGVHVPWWTQ